MISRLYKYVGFVPATGIIILLLYLAKPPNFIAPILDIYPTSLLGLLLNTVFWIILIQLVTGSMLRSYSRRSENKKLKNLAESKTLTFFIQDRKGKSDVLYFEDFNRHFICFGGSGSGKTYSFGRPILSYLIQNRPGIVIDPKGDLAEVVRTSHCKYPAIFFNPDDPATNQINPLDLLQDKNDIIQFSEYFLSNVIGIPQNDAAVYFFNSSNSILSAVILFLKNHHPKFCTLAHAIGLLLTIDHKQLSSLISIDDEAKRLGQILFTAAGSEKNVSSIMTTFSAFFAKLDSPTIFHALYPEEPLKIGAPNNPDNPYLLVLSISSPTKQSIYAPIYAALAGSLLQQMNFPGREDSFFFSDEFSVFKFPKYSLIPETARSNGVASILIMQDLEQLVKNYGREEAFSIIGNHSNHFVFGSRNDQTLSYYESLLGEEKVQRESFSSSTNSGGFGKPSSKSKSKTISTENSKIVSKSKIAQFEKGEFFGVFNDSNHRILNGFRLNGQHYLNTKQTQEKRGTTSDMDRVYKKVYEEIDRIIYYGQSVKSEVKPFNL